MVGCADLELSNGAVVERKGDDELVVRCPGSRETWYMTCGADNRWIGDIFNCSSSTSVTSIGADFHSGDCPRRKKYSPPCEELDPPYDTYQACFCAENYICS